MNDAAKLSDVIYQAVKDLTDIPVEYERLPTSGLPVLSVQTLTGSPIEKRYKDGSYVANYRYAVYLRQSAEDTNGRLDAMDTLSNLAQETEELSLDLGAGFALWSITQDTLPVKIDVGAAYDDYQVTFTVKYKAKRR